MQDPYDVDAGSYDPVELQQECNEEEYNPDGSLVGGDNFIPATVVNKYQTSYPYIYAGRGSPFGNPFIATERTDAERNRVCDLYETHFNTAMTQPINTPLKINVIRLIGMVRAGEEVVLGCFCKPKRCHCDTIVAYINANA